MTGKLGLFVNNKLLTKSQGKMNGMKGRMDRFGLRVLLTVMGYVRTSDVNAVNLHCNFRFLLTDYCYFILYL